MYYKDKTLGKTSISFLLSAWSQKEAHGQQCFQGADLTNSSQGKRATAVQYLKKIWQDSVNTDNSLEGILLGEGQCRVGLRVRTEPSARSPSFLKLCLPVCTDSDHMYQTQKERPKPAALCYQDTGTRRAGQEGRTSVCR